MSKKPIPDPRPQEQWLLELLQDANRWSFDDGTAPTILTNTLGFAQFAAGLGRKFASSKILCHFFDLYSQQLTANQWKRTRHGLPENVELVCDTDLPVQTLDRAIWFANHRGDAELTRDAFQQAHENLKIGGELWAVTDNPKDKWLHEQFEEMFSKVHCIKSEIGAIYWGTKTGPLKKKRDFSCEFPAKVDDHLLKLKTRPGVFSHRHVDPGARALLAHVKANANDKVLDFGCGGGFVALALAKRFNLKRVLAVDSQTRAVECTRWGAEQNELSAVEAMLASDGEQIQAGSFDVAAINPPYFGNHRVAEHFVDVSRHALRAGGRIFIVTKTPQWYLDYLPQAFVEVKSTVEKAYVIVTAIKRSN
ncbi:MAG: methyltransferase [Pirellulales bacterium]